MPSADRLRFVRWAGAALAAVTCSLWVASDGVAGDAPVTAQTVRPAPGQVAAPAKPDVSVGAYGLDLNKPLAVNWTSGHITPTGIVLENHTTQSKTVKVSLADPSNTLDVAERDVTIDGNQLHVVPLKLTGQWPSDGQSHYGMFLAKVDNEVSPVTVKIEIKPGDVRSPIQKFKHLSSRTFSWPTTSWIDWIEIPLVATAGLKMPTETNQILGYLASERGRFAAVRWRQNKPDRTVGSDGEHDTSVNGVCSYAADTACLEIEPLKAGQYQGSLSLTGSTDSKAQISLTLIAQASIIWPFLTILVGVVVAIVIAGLGNSRNIWALKQQVLKLSKIFARAVQQFDDAMGPAKSKTNYDITADFDTQKHNLLKGLDRPFCKRLFMPIDNDYKAFIAQRSSAIVAVQEQLKGFPQLGLACRSLNDLIETLLNKIHESPEWAGLGFPPHGQCLESGIRLVQGSPIQCAAIAAQCAQVTAQAELVRRWSTLYVRLLVGEKTILVDLNRLGEAGADPAAISIIKTQLADTKLLFWEVDSSGNLQNAASAMDDLWAAYAGLVANSSLPSDRGSLHTATAVPPGHSALTFASSPFAAAPETIRTDAKEAQLLKAAVLFSDWTTATSGFAIAELTGLSQYYFNKPFGSFGDYVALFLWAASAKVAVDLFVGLSARLASLAPTR
jgi:hypothetical protein